MPRLPATRSLTSPSERPRISAKSACDQPRASSSSRMVSPGGKTSAGRRVVIVCSRSFVASVLVLDPQDLDSVAGSPRLQEEHQPVLVVEPHRVLARPLAFELLEMRRL